MYHYAKRVKMHCDLFRHRGTTYTLHKQDKLFLSNITNGRYKDSATHLLLNLKDYEDRTLPLQYTINGLLDTMVDSNRNGLLDEIDLAPRVNNLSTAELSQDDGETEPDTGTSLEYEDGLPLYIQEDDRLQGFVPMINRIRADDDRNPRGRLQDGDRNSRPKSRTD